ncbi:hypothetical protein [Nocardioides sp.]|uniref:hypothetical protein n=1 Tax=Nocardioides sp. TaxID=35761 RepID=UPI00199D9E91|nr:hypothetical protein [Nocardioides sp.]MBC7278042.1 hypothetical protein [Nocardioides sp.]
MLDPITPSTEPESYDNASVGAMPEATGGVRNGYDHVNEPAEPPADHVEAGPSDDAFQSPPSPLGSETVITTASAADANATASVVFPLALSSVSSSDVSAGTVATRRPFESRPVSNQTPC